MALACPILALPTLGSPSGSSPAAKLRPSGHWSARRDTSLPSSLAAAAVRPAAGRRVLARSHPDRHSRCRRAIGGDGHGDLKGPPADLAAIARKCLEPDPADRYGSAAEFAADLRRFLGGVPTLAGRSSLARRAWRFARRHPESCVAFAAVLVAAGLIASRIGRESRAIAKSRIEQSRLEREAANGDYVNVVQAASELLRRFRVDLAWQALDAFRFPLKVKRTTRAASSGGIFAGYLMASRERFAGTRHAGRHAMFCMSSSPPTARYSRVAAATGRYVSGMPPAASNFAGSRSTKVMSTG